MRDRLESLRRWGNLTASSSVGNPTSLDDYNRRKHRYLITRKGQEVFDLVERVLATADEIGDVQATRLRDLRLALEAVREHIGTTGDSARGASSGLPDAVRAVFDIHDRFTTELTQFFVQLNEWQNRYDLSAEEVHVFASVLVDYVSEQLTEIERMVGPIGRSLEKIMAHLDDLLPALQSGLAARVEEAGLSDTVAVRRSKGADAEDWQHLAAWFVRAPGRPARLDQHTRQALAAVRTLTANVSRLARMGTGMSSRRSDFVRLAGFFDQAPTVEQAAPARVRRVWARIMPSPRDALVGRGRPRAHRQPRGGTRRVRPCRYRCGSGATSPRGAPPRRCVIEGRNSMI